MVKHPAPLEGLPKIVITWWRSWIDAQEDPAIAAMPVIAWDNSVQLVFKEHQ